MKGRRKKEKEGREGAREMHGGEERSNAIMPKSLCLTNSHSLWSLGGLT